MDEKTKALVERVESCVETLAYRHSTDAQDELFERDAPALCAAVREQDAEIEQAKASLLTALRSVAPKVAFLSAERNVVDLANLACAWIEGARQRLDRIDTPVRTFSSRRECARCCKPLYDMVVGAPDSAHCMCG